MSKSIYGACRMPGSDELVRWKMPNDGSLEAKRLVGMIRFHREDGLDPRIDPEPEGTHLSRGAPGRQWDQRSYDELAMEASCGRRAKGFADYGPLDGITCPDCAAMLAAQLLNESKIDG